MKLVEESSGLGQVAHGGEVISNVGYAISRYQGMTRGGLPVPGLHRIEGTLELDALPEALKRVGADFALTLEDGRVLQVTLARGDGRLLSEGHGPSRCTCC